MPSSIRNELKGTVKSVTTGDILSEILVETAAGEISSIITSRSVKDLDLKPGDSVCAQVKATSVSLCKCECQHH
jgi:molybdopterin-binding protein